MDVGKDVLLDKLQEHIADLLTAQPQASTACSQPEGMCAFSADLGCLDLVVQSMATAVVACCHNQGQLPPVALSLSLSLSMGTRVGEGRADKAKRFHERQECLGLIASAYTETIGARLEELLTNRHACTPARQGSRLRCADAPITSSHSDPLGSVGVSPCSRGQYRTGLYGVVMWALRYERTIKHLCGSLRRCLIPTHLHGWRHAVCSLGLDACKTSYACTGWGRSVPSLHGCRNTVVLHCGVLRVYSGLDCASTTDDADSSTVYKRSGSTGVGASCARGNIDGFKKRECWGGKKVCSDMELAVRVSRLQGCELFRSLSSDQLLWLAAFASTTRFSAGELVSAAVDERAAPQGAMAVIVDGSAILSPRLDGDNSAVVTRLGPSDSFMLASSLLNEPVGVSIRAATAVQVCVLPVEHVQQLLRQDAAFLRETAFAIHREMQNYSIVASAPPAPSVSAHSDPRSQSAQDAIIARLAARVGARSASTSLHAAPLLRMSARISGLKESFFADEFLDVFYSHCRPCLVVVVLLAGDGMTSLDATADRYAGAGSRICKAPDALRREKGTFLLRFSDQQTAQAWAEALGKYVWREGGMESPGVGGSRRRKDVGIVNGEQDTSILNNLASLVAFGSSPSGTRQSVDSQVSGIFAKHINQNDRELDLHGLLLGCRECVIALERALEDLDLASLQVDLAKEVAEVYLESIFARARLHLTATFPQHPNRKWMIDILCLFLTELPVILDKWALAESVGPHLRKLARGPIFDRLTACYLACMQASLHNLITNICLREVRLYRDDTYPDSADAAGQTVDVGKAGGCELGGVAEEGNGRVRSYLVEDLSCVMERELDLCTGVESGEFQSRVYVTCFRTCLDVLEKYRIFGRHVSGPYCVRQKGAAEDPGVQGLSDTISNSALASSCHSSASTTAFSSIFSTFSTTSRACETGRSTSITLRAACVALNNASDSCHMCDRLQDRMHDSLQGRLDHSLKSPGAHHSFLNLDPEKALSKLHEHFLGCVRLAEAVVVDACVCRLTAAGFFVGVSGECWEMFSKDEEARYREVEALLVDVSSYLSDALCQDKGRRDEQMNDEIERGLRHGTKEHGGGGEGHGKEAGCGGREIREIFSDRRESNYSDGSGARNEKDRGQWQERTTRKNISYWARRVCARLLEFFVMFHVEALRVFWSDSKCPPLQTVLDTLETVFKMYLEAFIISAKLLPLHASLDLLTCSPECIKERVAQHLEGGVHGDVCRICCLSRDLCPDTAGQIDALLRGSETLMSHCDRHGSPEGQRTSLVSSWSRSLARMQLSRSSGHAATARERWDASSSARGRWGLLRARQPAESPGFVQDTLATRGGGRGEDEGGMCAVQDSHGRVPEMAKIESDSTLVSPPSSLLSYWTERW
jgi:CRP-like cAMP-binding protein